MNFIVSNGAVFSYIFGCNKIFPKRPGFIYNNAHDCTLTKL